MMALISENLRQMLRWGEISLKLGLLRIPGIYPLNKKTLSDTEVRQQKLLMYRNAVNLDYIAESKAIYQNAQTVKAGGAISCPVMMFSSDGTETIPSWIPAQKRFSEENSDTIRFFDWRTLPSLLQD